MAGFSNKDVTLIASPPALLLHVWNVRDMSKYYEPSSPAVESWTMNRGSG